MPTPAVHPLVRLNQSFPKLVDLLTVWTSARSHLGFPSVVTVNNIISIVAILMTCLLNSHLHLGAR